MAAKDERPNYDHPWPKKSDRLFAGPPKAKTSRSTGSLVFGQILESMCPGPDYYCREGYYEAAQVLAAELGKSRHSYLLYPMLYCFRHYVELSLKSLLQVYANLVAEDVTEDLRKDHNEI